MRELETLERAVREHGELPRRELGRLVGCRYWGPGRFSRALRAGVRRAASRGRGAACTGRCADRKFSGRAALAPSKHQSDSLGGGET